MLKNKRCKLENNGTVRGRPKQGAQVRQGGWFGRVNRIAHPLPLGVGGVGMTAPGKEAKSSPRTRTGGLRGKGGRKKKKQLRGKNGDGRMVESAPLGFCCFVKAGGNPQFQRGFGFRTLEPGVLNQKTRPFGRGLFGVQSGPSWTGRVGDLYKHEGGTGEKSTGKTCFNKQGKSLTRYSGRKGASKIKKRKTE